MSFESFIDQQIRQAQDRGEFEKLKGAGKPLPEHTKGGLDSWVRQKLDEEGLSVPLPPALELRKEYSDTLAEVRKLKNEREVRRRLALLNASIRAVNSRQLTGPPTTVAPVDIDRFVSGWRRR